MLADREEDSRLTNAMRVSMETQQVTPIIKEELRLSIMKKRHASGQDDIKVEFEEPKKYELTEQEEMKRERRREQNRRAAQRCRQKKKAMQSGKNEIFSSVINQNKKLQAEVVELRKQKRKLKEIFSEHVRSGCCQQRCAENQTLPVPDIVPMLPPTEPSYQNILEDFQRVGTLPSFNDTFCQEPFPICEPGFDMRSETTSTRTWSGTSDDVIPNESIENVIFNNLCPSDPLDDDVFYNNEPIVNADPCNAVPEWAMLDASFASLGETLGENPSCLDPSFFNEP